MTIEVLICTIGAGILKVAAVMAAPRDDVRYLVSYQYNNEEDIKLIPDSLREREDVRVLAVKGRGLSANRNHALRNAVGDILIFADDDNRYSWENFDALLTVAAAHPDVDAFCLRSQSYQGILHRNFPRESFNLRQSPRGYYVRSCELALRRNARCPEFDTCFGLGSKYLACGEEEIFIIDMVRTGFKACYYPVTLVSTDAGTTGSKFLTDAAVRRSKGAVLAAIHGQWGALLRIAKYAALNVNGMSRFVAFIDMLRGIRYAKKIGRC